MGLFLFDFFYFFVYNGTTMILLGIDPGAKGAIAIFKDNKTEVFSFNGNPLILDQILFKVKEENNFIAKAYIEKMHGMPMQGTSSTFKLGYNYGIAISLLEHYKIGYMEISTNTWQKAFGLIIKHDDKDKGKKLKTSDKKKKSIEMANKLYPELNIGKDDGKADALLILEYLKRIESFAK
jgi:hypothetical protein